MTLSKKADRRTLIRRLHFDLLGLPPAPHEVETFLSDPDPKAYEKLIERLLSSKHYGERWARHWLDVVHYGESHGYDKDKPRPHAWPYRDYVIRAFNEDKPYHRFIKEQVAGDVLWPDTVDGLEATGFLAAGPWDFIGHAEVPEEKIDGKVARHLDRDDMVTTTMNTFCSLTVQCAQCHDHKRDPVTMEDYYSLQSVFAALDRADRSYDRDPATGRRRSDLESAKSREETTLKELNEEIEAKKTDRIRRLEEKIARLQTTLEATGEIKGKQRSGNFGYHSAVADKEGVEKWVQVDLGNIAGIDQVALFGADEYGFPDFGFPHRFRIETALTSDFETPVVIADHTKEDYERPGTGPAVFQARSTEGRYVRVTATRLWNRRQKGKDLTGDWIFALGELAILVDGQKASAKKVTALDSIEALPRWGRSNLIDGVYGRYSLDEGAARELIKGFEKDRSRVKEELVVLRKKKEKALNKVAAEPLRQRDIALKKLAGLKADLGSLPKQQKVYAGIIHHGSGAFKGRGHLGGKPREIRVLHRGEVTQPQEEVAPATVPGIVRDLPH
ncbi:MAG: DUF1549 domain-containing protein, partial [Verrucomicrobiota bacterium]